jgi:hypothetical protein
MDWLVLTYRLPAEPSRHRVAVWRELRRVGAVSLQQATWALPSRAEFLAALDRSSALVERAGGEMFVFEARPRGEESERDLERLFTDEREQEWGEFLSECAKYQEEIAKEIRTEKFTAAELDEEEQSLERLQRWNREIRSRDLFGAPSASAAELELKRCAESLEGFAQGVFERGDRA